MDIDTPSVVDLIRWLRERAVINRRQANQPPQAWESRLMPHFALRLDQIADALERTDYWRPIETAPNDQSILVAHDDDSVSLIEADENTYDWQPYPGPTVGVVRPKLWMPTPKPKL